MPNVYKVVLCFGPPRWVYYTYLVVGADSKEEAIAEAKSRENCEYLHNASAVKVEKEVIEVGFELW